jgi:hypothetical protein
MGHKMAVLEGDALQVFKDNLATGLFGMTTTEAQEKIICIDCKKSMEAFENKLERDEWHISGLCTPCFDRNSGG